MTDVLKPKSKGPSDEQLAAQKASEDRAERSEERANKELSSASRFTKNRRTGRRLLLAPGREDVTNLGDGNKEGGNF